MISVFNDLCMSAVKSTKTQVKSLDNSRETVENNFLQFWSIFSDQDTGQLFVFISRYFEADAYFKNLYSFNCFRLYSVTTE